MIVAYPGGQPIPVNATDALVDGALDVQPATGGAKIIGGACSADGVSHTTIGRLTAAPTT